MESLPNTISPEEILITLNLMNEEGFKAWLLQHYSCLHPQFLFSENEICSRSYLLTTYVSDGSCDCCVKIDTFFENREEKHVICQFHVMKIWQDLSLTPIKHPNNKCYIFFSVTGHDFLSHFIIIQNNFTFCILAWKWLTKNKKIFRK